MPRPFLLSGYNSIAIFFIIDYVFDCTISRRYTINELENSL